MVRDRLVFKLKTEDILVFYLQYFLILDIFNGVFIKVIRISEAVSPGQFIRLLAFGLLNHYFFVVAKKLTKELLFLYLVVCCYLVAFSIINGIQLGVLVSEISFFIKLLSYLLIVFFCHLHLDMRQLERIVHINFIVYCSTISLGYISGFGLDTYRTYDSSKGLFNANNATAITGLTFGVYYFFIQHSMKRVLIITLVLFFTGSKVVFIVAAFLGIYALQDFMVSIRTLTKRVWLYIAGLVIGFFYFIPFVVNELWEGKYKARVLMAFYHSRNEGLLDGGYNKLIELYSYVAYTRAYKVAYVFEYLSEHKTRIFLGIGSFLTKKVLFGGEDHIESDLGDMLIMYGVLGLLFYLIFHLSLIFNTPKGASFLAIFILGYSIVGGHYVYTPMSYTLAGCILGYYYKRK